MTQDIEVIECGTLRKFHDTFYLWWGNFDKLSSLDNPLARAIGVFNATTRQHLTIEISVLKLDANTWGGEWNGESHRALASWAISNLQSAKNRHKLFGDPTEEGAAFLRDRYPRSVMPYDLVVSALRGTDLPSWFVDELVDLALKSGFIEPSEE
jgi:hypothetical protein